MNIIITIDEFFIGNNEGALSDRLWFYGTYAASLFIVSFIIYN